MVYNWGMKKILWKTSETFTPEEAEKAAATLNADADDDWVYTVKHDPAGTGYSLIEVHDERGEFVSLL